MASFSEAKKKFSASSYTEERSNLEESKPTVLNSLKRDNMNGQINIEENNHRDEAYESETKHPKAFVACVVFVFLPIKQSSMW